MAVILQIALLTLMAQMPLMAQSARVGGRVSIIEKNKKPSRDLGDAVIYLEGGVGGGPAARPPAFEIAISDKVYVPHVLVVPVGSTVRFPNHDPFDHNVFSVSDSNQFDLGLYGRGEAKSHLFAQPGLARVYCNVHPRMVAYVAVMATRYYAQPGADGSFVIADVAPGRYRLHAWHERISAEVVQDLTVGPDGAADLQVALDARGYKWQPHKNKYGEEYPTTAGRERY